MKKTNRDRLREIIAKHELTRQTIADMVAGGSLDTVNAWLKPDDNRGHRNMPNEKLELLELKLPSLKR